MEWACRWGGGGGRHSRLYRIAWRYRRDSSADPQRVASKNDALRCVPAPPSNSVWLSAKQVLRLTVPLWKNPADDDPFHSHLDWKNRRRPGCTGCRASHGRKEKDVCPLTPATGATVAVSGPLAGSQPHSVVGIRQWLRLYRRQLHVPVSTESGATRRVARRQDAGVVSNQRQLPTLAEFLFFASLVSRRTKRLRKSAHRPLPPMALTLSTTHGA